jgi:DNA-binding CsgD family transcriptional regulator
VTVIDAVDAMDLGFLLPADRWVKKHHIKILALAANGYTNEEIAQAMWVGLETVKTHWQRMKRRMGARDRTHCVAIAMMRGWIQPNLITLDGRKEQP